MGLTELQVKDGLSVRGDKSLKAVRLLYGSSTENGVAIIANFRKPLDF